MYVNAVQIVSRYGLKTDIIQVTILHSLAHLNARVVGCYIKMVKVTFVWGLFTLTIIQKRSYTN